MSEFTDNLTFADPILENGIPKFINSLNDLKAYAHSAHDIRRLAFCSTDLFRRYCNGGSNI